MSRIAHEPGCWAAWGGSEEVHSGRTWPGRAHVHVSLRFMPGYTPASEWEDRGSRWQAQSESVHEGWDHGPHVTASGCRHDGSHRGSKRFFLPSPTEKHADVEQFRWALVAAGAAVGSDQAPRPRPGSGV